MADDNVDGKITLGIDVDVTKSKEKIEDVKRQAKELAKAYEKAGLRWGEAVKKANAELGINNELTKANETIKDTEASTRSFGVSVQQAGTKAKTAFSSFGSVLTTVLRKLAIFFSVYKLIGFIKQSTQLAGTLEATRDSVNDTFGDMAETIEEFSKTAITRLGMTEQQAQSMAVTYGTLAKTLGVSQTDAVEMSMTLTALAADLASYRSDLTKEQAATALKGVFTGEMRSMKNLGIIMTQTNLEQFALEQGITKSVDAMTQQEKAMLRYQYVLKKTGFVQGDFTRDVNLWSNQISMISARWTEVKTTMGEAFMYYGRLILPIINNILARLQVFAEDFKTVAMAVYELFGGNLYHEAQQDIEDVAEAQDEITESLEATAEAQKKVLAGFDDIEKLTEDSNLDDVEFGDELQKLTGNVSSKEINDADKYAEAIAEVKKALLDLARVLPTLLVAIGLLCLAFGNVGWGLGFIFAGAGAYAVQNQKTGEYDITRIKTMLSEISKYIPEALMAIGLICLALGKVGLGLGFIVVGAIAEGYKDEKTRVFDYEQIFNMLKDIQQYVPQALMAIGLICIFASKIALGVALIAAGAVAYIGAKKTEEPEKSLKEIAQDFLEENKEIIAAGSTILFFVGLIMLLMGNISPLAIGMIVTGAAGFAAEEALNGSSFNAMIQKFLTENSWLIAGGSLILLLIGVLLCITGVGIALGIGMIVVGAAGLVTEAVLNWGAISQTISNVFTSIWLWLKGWPFLILGIILCFTGVGIPLGLGLIKLGADGLTEKKDPLWDTIKTKVTKAFQDIKDWLHGWPELILGIILCLSGVGIPLGLGLIYKGVEGLEEKKDPAWGTIKEELVKAWNGIKQWWDTDVKQVFTIDFWKEKFSNIGKGLTSAINSAKQAFVDFWNWLTGHQTEEIEVAVSPKVDFSGNKDPKGVIVPRLAKGAVIPPNSSFLAMLGDQKSGTNIETPLATMVEAFSQALDNRGTEPVQVHLYLDGKEVLDTVIKRNRENTRMTGINELAY